MIKQKCHLFAVSFLKFNMFLKCLIKGAYDQKSERKSDAKEA